MGTPILRDCRQQCGSVRGCGWRTFSGLAGYRQPRELLTSACIKYTTTMVANCDPAGVYAGERKKNFDRSGPVG